MPYEGRSDPYKRKKKYGAAGGYEEDAKKYKPGYKERGYEVAEEVVPSLIREPKTYVPERVREERVISSRLVPRVEPDIIKPLKLISTEIIGGIFDRVRFLEQRIAELRGNIETRNKINAQILDEIEKDIDDRMQFLNAITDINERRNLKLDISVLRKERRHENVQYWRDLVELSTELRKLEEEYEIERKIAGMFSELRDEAAGEEKQEKQDAGEEGK